MVRSHYRRPTLRSRPPLHREEPVIDVGVADGTLELYEAFPSARHLLVEAVAEFEPTLRWIARRYGAEYVVAAADEIEGMVEVDLPTDLHDASLLVQNPGRARAVRAITPDALCRERQLGGPYLVKIDVQGAELRVLGGAHSVLEHAEVVVLEASLFRFRSEVPDVCFLLTWMKERGFVVYDVIGGCTRPLDGALAQVDLAFVKEDGRFRASHAFATAEQVERHRRGAIARPRRFLRM